MAALIRPHKPARHMGLAITYARAQTGGHFSVMNQVSLTDHLVSDEEVRTYVLEVGGRARKASGQIASASTSSKNQALEASAAAMERARVTLRAENQKDLDAARGKGLSEASLDRLELTEKRIDAMIAGVRQVRSLPDPVGEITGLHFRPDGFQVGRMRVPIGVVGIIYESRPNVTADAAALCLKSGNACILRGGSEALHSNRAIARCIQDGLIAAGLSADVVQLIQTTDRRAVGYLITMEEHLDVIIPRGGKSLIERIARDAQVPVIKHLDGICHVYIDADADLHKAVRVAVNAKTQRYGVCNTMETLLVHADIAARVYPELVAQYQKAGVELRVCARTRPFIPSAVAASEQDWSTEYLAPILSIKTLDHLDEAIAHIARYGSHHTDAIITENYTHAMRFLREVDSSSVMVNASTRLADGFEFGLGAEIGISTNKLHARGPVGLEGLTNQKFVVLGDGHIRS